MALESLFTLLFINRTIICARTLTHKSYNYNIGSFKSASNS